MAELYDFLELQGNCTKAKTIAAIKDKTREETIRFRIGGLGKLTIDTSMKRGWNHH
jgi:hypothetical protein